MQPAVIADYLSCHSSGVLTVYSKRRLQRSMRTFSNVGTVLKKPKDVNELCKLTGCHDVLYRLRWPRRLCLNSSRCRKRSRHAGTTGGTPGALAAQLGLHHLVRLGEQDGD